jgi:diguanylate cyclase (GGDEF)-like protein
MPNLSGESQDKLNRTLIWIEELELQKNAHKISDEEYRERIARAFVARDRLLDRAKVNTDFLRKLANMDGLTELPNRRYLDRTLEREIAKVQRTGEELGLLLLDVDHFKYINDQYGHGVGDQVLKRIGRLLGRIVRGSDFAGRYGGEEFEVIAVNPAVATSGGSDGLLTAGERLRMAVRGEQIEALGGNQITLSIGATRLRSGDNLTSFRDRADKALHQSKTDGRNQVTVF